MLPSSEAKRLSTRETSRIGLRKSRPCSQNGTLPERLGEWRNPTLKFYSSKISMIEMLN